MQSDHFVITFIIPESAPPPAQVASQYVFDFPKADYQGLCDYLLDIDFSHLFSLTDVEFIWSSLKNAIYTGMDIFIPKVRLKKHQYPRWYTAELRHLSKCIQTVKRKIHKHPTDNSTQKLFQTSLIYETIPLEWKCHSITPIHKSGDRSCVSNYRPISLLCNISKVLERIVFNHLSKFITQTTFYQSLSLDFVQTTPAANCY